MLAKRERVRLIAPVRVAGVGTWPAGTVAQVIHVDDAFPELVMCLVDQGATGVQTLVAPVRAVQRAGR